MQFSDCLTSTRNDISQYYQNAADQTSATLVVLSSGGAKSGVDAQLAAGTSISGHAYAGSGTGTPLKNVCVNVQAKSPAGSSNYYYANTDASGAYVINHVPPITGGYTVQFRDCNLPATYVSQYYGGDYSGTTTTIAPRVDAPAQGIDAHLDLGGTIAGTVTDSGGHPITSGLCATATMTGNPGKYYSGSSSQLDSAGRYTIPGLPTGSYTVSFDDCGAQRNDVAQTFATTVSVTLGQPTIGVNATMLPGTSISGAVYGGPGTATPVSGVCVQVLKPTGQVVGLYNAGYATSGPDGSYAVSHLPPGQSYVVQFNYASYWPVL